jgi:hypothetical protein
LVIPEEPDVVAAGQFLETFADIWVEVIPKERKELLGLLLEEVLVDVAEDRIVCVRPKASFCGFVPADAGSPGAGRLFSSCIKRSVVVPGHRQNDRMKRDLTDAIVYGILVFDI